ncbi:hypothetical protein T4D_10560 [Trichinella pseudospiralis]|uniref:Secreted protein n=1 Tax=Trichinella pseudospiralis TaxID=6337 RepID=A0A0V1F5C5_TRIPS|nr:hypothetical protein T4D_10560 [Trichinella pseudospiralis]
MCILMRSNLVLLLPQCGECNLDSTFCILGALKSMQYSSILQQSGIFECCNCRTDNMLVSAEACHVYS